MPHAIYVHSALARDRHGPALGPDDTSRLLRATKWDVGIALSLAGIVNIGMLLLAAVNLRDVAGTDTIEGAHAAIQNSLGPVVALVFAIGLLASGLASTSVGSYAGATIMAGLLKRRIPIFLRRVITLVPALLILGLGANPTSALVISQVLLSFGIPFALVPLLRLTNDPGVMGGNTNGRLVRLALGAIVLVVVVLNVVLIVLTVVGG
jgi:manganese transport protein